MKTPDIDKLTRDEISLLLYAESCMVDYGGLYQFERTNEADRKIMDRWRKDGFMDHGRVASECLRPHVSLWLRLSPEGVAMAQELRRRRIERGWNGRKWYSTAEKREMEVEP